MSTDYFAITSKIAYSRILLLVRGLNLLRLYMHSASQSVSSRSVRRLVGRSVGRSVSRSVGQSVGRSVSQSVSLCALGTDVVGIDVVSISLTSF